LVKKTSGNSPRSRRSRTFYEPRPRSNGFGSAASQIVEIGREFYQRGWVLGTSGNFSSVLRHDPLCLAITSTGSDKGRLLLEQILEIGETFRVVRGEGRPSAETSLHFAVVRGKNAGAVLHTHSVWSTVLSEQRASEGGVAIEGYEMLKGLEGVSSHKHREWLPIIENSQDIEELAREVSHILKENPLAHGFLLRAHGLYTWGTTVAEARRHVEILEFLMETLVRVGSVGQGRNDSVGRFGVEHHGHCANSGRKSHS
jgi:methylthioribulose-1-phosphate dehydratase